MRKSSIILIIAGILMALSILSYDWRLRDSFKTGKYRLPYGNYVEAIAGDFDSVQVISASAVNVKFIQGARSVRVEKYASEYTRIQTVGHRLTIEAIYPNHLLFNPNDYLVVVSCPRLRVVETDARYISAGQTITDAVFRPEWNMRTVLIDGFHQDSLQLRLANGSSIRLSNDTLDELSVQAGINPGSGSRFTIPSGNLIGRARIQAAEQSVFFLDNARIADLSFHLTDSASLNVSGAAQHLLTTLKPWIP